MILVLGATGTVGSAVVEALKKKGVAVKAASRDPKKAEAQLGVPAVAWDWEQPAAFAAALQGVDALFLLTPPGTLEELRYGLAAVEAAKAAGVKKIVKLSAIGVEQQPESAHRKIELAVEAGGFAWTFLRPSFFMQNLNEGSLQGIREAGAIFLPTGDGKTGMIDARDIGAVAAEALTRSDLDGQGLTLTGPEALSYAQMAEQLSQATGKAIKHVDISPDDFKAALVKAGVPEHYAGFLVNLYGFVKAGYTAALTPTVQTVLGRPATAFSHYAKDYAGVFKA